MTSSKAGLLACTGASKVSLASMLRRGRLTSLALICTRMVGAVVSGGPA
jgi:hypothetical protein